MGNLGAAADDACNCGSCLLDESFISGTDEEPVSGGVARGVVSGVLDAPVVPTGGSMLVTGFMNDDGNETVFPAWSTASIESTIRDSCAPKAMSTAAPPMPTATRRHDCALRAPREECMVWTSGSSSKVVVLAAGAMITGRGDRARGRVIGGESKLGNAYRTSNASTSCRSEGRALRSLATIDMTNCPISCGRSGMTVCNGWMGVMILLKV